MQIAAYWSVHSIKEIEFYDFNKKVKTDVEDLLVSAWWVAAAATSGFEGFK